MGQRPCSSPGQRCGPAGRLGTRKVVDSMLWASLCLFLGQPRGAAGTSHDGQSYLPLAGGSQRAQPTNFYSPISTGSQPLCRSERGPSTYLYHSIYTPSLPAAPSRWTGEKNEGGPSDLYSHISTDSKPTSLSEPLHRRKTRACITDFHSPLSMASQPT